MPTPNITLAIRVLVDRLKAIAPAAGYNTDLGGRVYRGLTARIAAQVQEDEGRQLIGVPLLYLTPASEDYSDADTVPDAYTGDQVLVRDYVLIGAVEAVEDYDEALSALLWDMRRSLVHRVGDELLGGYATSITLGSAEFLPPEEGSRLAQVSIPLTIVHVENYGA